MINILIYVWWEISTGVLALMFLQQRLWFWISPAVLHRHCWRIIQESLFSFTSGMINFPSWVIMETLIQILKYFGITPGIPQQLLEKNQQYPMQLRKKLWFPQAGVIQMLKEEYVVHFKQIQELQDFSWILIYIQRSDITCSPTEYSGGKILYSGVRYHNPLQSFQIQKSSCILSKSKSYRFPPILLSPERMPSISSKVYPQRSLPEEWPLSQFQRIQELQDFPCNIILFPENPQRRPQKFKSKNHRESPVFWK